jgi:hypothetical protein
MRTKLLITFLLLTTAGGIAELIWHHHTKAAYPPEIEAFRSKLKDIHHEMNEGQVDAILGAYSSSKSKAKCEYDFRGDELLRPSASMKYYNQTEKPAECDYFIAVYLDESGYVVGKAFGAYER